MVSLKTFLNFVSDALSRGKPSWEGSGGMFSIKKGFQDLGNAVIERGIMEAGSLHALQLLGSADTRFALVRGVGIYAYYELNAMTLPAGAVTANNGGRWELLVDLSNPVVTTFETRIGDGSNTTFRVTHGLNTLSPTIVMVDTIGGLPFPVATEKGEYFVVDEDNIDVTINSGAQNNQYSITVKP